MQRLWNMIQATIFTGAAVTLMAVVANQAIDRKPVIVAESKPVESQAPAAQEQVKPQSQTIDIPIPDGRISGITQTVTISGGRIVSASVTFDQ